MKNLILIALFLPLVIFAEEPKLINIDPNNQALILHPNPKKTLPVIIYNHGLIVEKLGVIKTAKKGYDIRKFVKSIAKNNFVAIAPIRKADVAFPQVIKKLLAYIEKEKSLDQKKVSIIGFSKGGALTLEVATYFDRFRSVVLMSPALSEKTLNKLNFHHLMAPTLTTLGDKDSANLVKINKNLAKKLKGKIAINTYPGNHQSFWKWREDCWGDIIKFIKRNN